MSPGPDHEPFACHSDRFALLVEQTWQAPAARQTGGHLVSRAFIYSYAQPAREARNLLMVCSPIVYTKGSLMVSRRG
jgi:hypothetical protein